MNGDAAYMVRIGWTKPDEKRVMCRARITAKRVVTIGRTFDRKTGAMVGGRHLKPARLVSYRLDGDHEPTLVL